MRSLTIALLFFCAIAQAKIPRFEKVTDTLYRGGQPENAADFAQLKALGVKTVINLRTSDSKNEETQVEGLGMTFKKVPINSFFSPRDSDVEQVLTTMTDPQAGPVFVHCAYGEDRTGLMIGLYRVMVQKWTAQKAFHEMLDHGFKPFLLGLYVYYWTHVWGL